MSRLPASLCLVALLSACGAEDASGHAHDGSTNEGPEGDGATSDATMSDAAPRDTGVGEAADRDGAQPGATDAAVPSEPAPCTLSSQGALPTGQDTFVPNTGKKQVSALTYANVGASGSYAEVVSGWSKATGCVGDSDGNLCRTTYRKPKQVNGPLAPFNEEMTFVFGGPIELYQLAVYSPALGAYQRDAYWDRCTTQGLAFVGNKSWFECAGFVQSYVTADGTAESKTPVQFAGKVAAGTEVHVMSDRACRGDECGYTTGLPLHGFAGDAAGSKIFAVKLRMPIGSTTPAYWILPSQVVRSNQYGCNCRGQGSDATYKGGCGELDVAEILGGVTTSLEATTTLYSFQDITGGGDVTFHRPVHEAATFIVIFDAPGRRIAIHRLAAEAFDFSSVLSSARVAELLAEQGALRTLR